MAECAATMEAQPSRRKETAMADNTEIADKVAEAVLKARSDGDGTLISFGSNVSEDDVLSAMADSGFAVKTGMETSDAALPRCNEKTLRRIIVRSYLAGTHGDDFNLMFAKLPETYGLEALTAYEESWAAYFTGAQHPSPHKDETMPQSQTNIGTNFNLERSL